MIIGLMLHNSLAAALDRGDIAIVPVPPVDDEVTEWKLILTKEALRSKGALKFGDRIIYWKVNLPTSSYILPDD